MPLYDGAEINQESSLWAIMDSCITHKLLYKYNSHCPSPNRLVQSGYMLSKGYKGVMSKNFHNCSSFLAELSATAQIGMQEEFYQQSTS